MDDQTRMKMFDGFQNAERTDAVFELNRRAANERKGGPLISREGMDDLTEMYMALLGGKLVQKHDQTGKPVSKVLVYVDVQVETDDAPLDVPDLKRRYEDKSLREGALTFLVGHVDERT